MNKESFLSQLKQKLTALSSEEREAALTYYEEYFNDAGIENEQAVINELGSVEKVANGILKENNYPVGDNNNADNKNSAVPSDSKANNINYGTIAILIIFYIILSPVIIPFFFAIFGVLLGFSIAGIAILISGFAVSIAGITSMFLSPINGLLILGVGFILLALGILISTFMINLCAVGIPSLVRGIVKIFKYPFQKGGINL
jgi:uncharacterized membrane protein